jgi:superfamily II DNA helicase RecQ
MYPIADSDSSCAAIQAPVNATGNSITGANDVTNVCFNGLAANEECQFDPQIVAGAKTVLWKIFGHTEFMPGQLEAVHSVIKSRDSSIVLATGGGKSMCYQIPAILTRKIVVVVSPLISLMKDQVLKINQTIQHDFATYLSTSNLMHSDCEARAARGEFSIVYVTPEKLSFCGHGGNDVLSRMARCPKGVALIAVDEAHCVCEWGNDFRPDYRNLKRLQKKIFRQDFRAQSKMRPKTIFLFANRSNCFCDEQMLRHQVEGNISGDPHDGSDSHSRAAHPPRHY